MITLSRKELLLGCLMVAACTQEAERIEARADVQFEPTTWRGDWYRGNTHAHTTESDGDSSPEYVARWYKDHGYDFLVLTDHNVFTDPVALAHISGSSFLLIPGEEITSSFDGASVHVNGLNLPGLVEARTAVDDAHHFQGEFTADRSNPGRGWVAVRAASLDPDALMESLEAGHFYSSTGVPIEDIVVGERHIEIQIGEDLDFRYFTTFFGRSGEVLHETTSNPARYELSGDPGYVRARVRNSRGDLAWTQPVFTTPR